MPIVAGVRISRKNVLTLAAKLRDDGSESTARLLLDAFVHGEEFVALSTDDRVAILAVLDHPTQELAELRSVLFSEVIWRRNAWLAERRRPQGVITRAWTPNTRSDVMARDAMYLTGIPIPPTVVLELAQLVDDDHLATKLRSALARDVKVLALEPDERVTILAALQDAPPGLGELRATLLQEHVGRKRDGL
jgi:hypothetical protein